MSKIIKVVQTVLGKVFAHKYTGFVIKTPFVNISFAPTSIYGLALFTFVRKKHSLLTACKPLI